MPSACFARHHESHTWFPREEGYLPDPAGITSNRTWAVPQRGTWLRVPASRHDLVSIPPKGRPGPKHLIHTSLPSTVSFIGYPLGEMVELDAK